MSGVGAVWRGAGLHPDVCLVQGHMTAGRRGGKVSNLVFV